MKAKKKKEPEMKKNKKKKKNKTGSRQNVNIYNLIKLAHIPEINYILRETMASIEDGPLTGTVTKYQEKVKRVYRKLYLDVVTGQLKRLEPAYPLLYWFEITPFASGDWGLTTISPWPTEIDPHFVIMPQDLIDRVKDHPLEEGKLAELKAVFSPMSQRLVDLRFMRLSPNHICGTVRLNIRNIKALLETRGQVGEVELRNDPEKAFQAFLYFLHYLPWFKDEFIEEFYSRVTFGAPQE
jgi:hypothetical protein